MSNISAFPSHCEHVDCSSRERSDGMSLRDYFAAAAPAPTPEWIKYEAERDHAANPHGDSYKPKIRGRLEIEADWRYAYADAMLKAREKKP